MKMFPSILAIVLLVVSTTAQAKDELIWCRGPLELFISGTTIEVRYKSTKAPAGKNGGRLKPGQCAREKTPSSTAGRNYAIQILNSPPKWKEEPWRTFICSTYIQLLSNPDYVVSMGTQKGRRFECRGILAIPFKKDRTIPLTPRKFSR